MTFPFRRHKEPLTAREAREFATIIRSAEVAMPRMRHTLSFEELRALQQRSLARRRAAAEADAGDI
jgi:hypothetical protein